MVLNPGDRAVRVMDGRALFSGVYVLETEVGDKETTQ